MKLEITVCNVCKAVDRPVTEYTVKSGERLGKADLCEEHGAPFEQVLPPRRGRTVTPTAKPATGKPPSARRTRRGGTPIMTLDEIERAKAAKAS